MAATPVMSMVAAKAALDAITALLGSSAVIEVRTGSPPATTLDSATGTLLATLTMSASPFGAATSAEANGKAKATAAAITSDTSADATGTAGWFLIKSGAGTRIFQGTCGTSSADFVLNTVSITSGDTVACTACIVRLANGTTAE